MEGCPSLRSRERVVISSNVRPPGYVEPMHSCPPASFVILLNALLSTATAGGRPPGYVEPNTGCFCPTQLFAPASFHKLPLQLKYGNAVRIHVGVIVNSHTVNTIYF